MKKIILAAAVVLLSIINLSAKNLRAEMTLLASWFDGRFDNYAQVYEEREAKAEFPQEHMHSIFKRVELPAIGKYVFYVQQYLDGDESKIYRQRLYNFTVDKAEKAIRLTIYTFDDEIKYRDSQTDPSKLSGLTTANLATTPGCEVFWKLNQEGDRFEGYMKKDACRVVSKRSGKTIIITDDLFLTKDEIWINDQARDEQGNYVFGNKSGVHAKLKRVRWFEGWTAVLKSGESTPANRDFAAGEYDGQTKIVIHDQGGTAKINDKYSVQLARLRHQSGAWFLTLKILENSTGKAVAYSWANPEAEKLGINLRWVQAGFSLKK